MSRIKCPAIVFSRRLTLRYWRRRCEPCWRACHSPSPGTLPLSPVRPNRWRFAGSMSTNRSSGPGAWRLDTRTVIRFWRRLRAEKSGTGQSGPAIDKRRATLPGVCRSGSPGSTSTRRHHWIAASLDSRGRPLRPALGASHVMSLSRQISRDPRHFSASLQNFQVVVRERAASGPVMREA